MHKLVIAVMLGLFALVNAGGATVLYESEVDTSFWEWHGDKSVRVVIGYTREQWENDIQSVEVPTQFDVDEVDWEQEVPIAAFLGLCPSGGYDVVIRKVVLEGEILNVYVDKRSPGPGDFVTMALTNPYDIIKIERERLRNDPILQVHE